jgi:hypothetical protein
MADDRPRYEPQVPDEDAGDPAAAFDALRRTVETQGARLGAEMTVIRRGLEAAFEQIDKIEPPQDYKPQLAQLVQALAAVSQRLDGVEQSPLLRQGAEHYSAVLERAGTSLVHAAARELERQAGDLERIGRNLAAHVQSAHDRKRQDVRMWAAGIAGVLIGIVLLLALPRFLPFSLDSRVAGLIMGRDRVGAGRAIIEAADPAGHRDMMTGGWVYEKNRAALDKCIAAMLQTRQDQRCVLTLPAVDGGARP